MTWQVTMSDDSLQPTDYNISSRRASERPHSSSTEGAFLITIPGLPRFARKDTKEYYPQSERSERPHTSKHRRCDLMSVLSPLVSTLQATHALYKVAAYSNYSTSPVA